MPAVQMKPEPRHAKTLTRSPSSYNYEDYLYSRTAPLRTKGDGGAGPTKQRTKLTRHRLKERYQEMKMHSKSIHQSRQTLLRKHKSNNGNHKNSGSSHQAPKNTVMEKKLEENAEILLQKLYKGIMKKYSSLKTWYEAIKKIKGLCNHKFNHSWIEKILPNAFATTCGINTKMIESEVFMHMLSLQSVSISSITCTSFLDLLYSRLEKFALEMVDTNYFIKEIDRTFARASSTILKSQKKLKRKIKDHFYEDEFMQSTQNSYTRMNISNDKIIDAIIGKKCESNHASRYKDHGRNKKLDAEKEELDQKRRHDIQKNLFPSRSKVFKFDVSNRFNDAQKVPGQMKNVLKNSIEMMMGNTVPSGTFEHSNNIITEVDSGGGIVAEGLVATPPRTEDGGRQRQLSARTEKIAKMSANAKKMDKDKNEKLTLDQYKFPGSKRKTGNNEDRHDFPFQSERKYDSQKELVEMQIPRSRQNPSRSDLPSRSFSGKHGDVDDYHHAFTPETVPPTAFRHSYHHLGDDEIHAKKNAIETYEWRRLDNKVSKRYKYRSNEVQKKVHEPKQHADVLGVRNVAEKIVSLKTKHHTDRPMSIRHRLLEASDQLKTFPCHYGIKSHDVSHQVESARDHSNKGLNDNDIAVICHGISNVKNLDFINFSNNRISGIGCEVIADLLNNNDNILHLDLSGNGGIGSAGIKNLSNGFAHLLELNLSRCKINNDSAVLLCNGLISNHAMESLSLANNEISDRGAKEIGKMLPRHTNLRDLILKWNIIGNAGAAAIAYGLRDSHCKLESLDMSFNAFGGAIHVDNPALEFSQALFTNKNLHHLNLAHNRLTRHDIYIILRRIDLDNDTLLSIHLEGNWMPRSCKTHEGSVNNKEAAMTSLDSHEGEEIQCSAFTNALFGRNIAANASDPSSEIEHKEETRNDRILRGSEEDTDDGHVIHDLSIRTHVHASNAAYESHVIESNLTTTHHPFMQVERPGNSFVFTRVLGRPHMKHEMEWKEVGDCWVCCGASEHCFHAKTLNDIGIRKITTDKSETHWRSVVEVHYFDSTGIPRVGGHSFLGEQADNGFKHYAMVCPGKIHYLFRDGTVPYDPKAARARSDRNVYTHAQHERRIDAAKMLQRRWRKVRNLKPFTQSNDNTGRFHVNTQQKVERTSRKEFVYTGESYANHDFVKPRDTPLMPDTTFIRRRKEKTTKKWSLKSSCFKHLHLDSDPLMRKALRVDWHAVNYAKFFKSHDEASGVYTVLLHHYKHIVSAFKLYCTDTYDLALSEELFNVSKIMFLKMLEDIQVLHDKLSNRDRGAYERIYLGSLLSKENKKLMGLYRPQFTSALITSACTRYMNDENCKGSKVLMVKKFFDQDFSKLTIFDYDEFRKKFLFNRESDTEVSYFIPNLKKIFRKHSQMNIETREKAVLFLPGMISTLKLFHVDEVADKREIYRTFIRSQVTPVTKFEDPLKMFLRFHEYLDCLCWFAFLATIPHKDRDEVDNQVYLQTHMRILPKKWYQEELNSLLKLVEAHNKKNTIQFTMLSKLKAKLHTIRRRAQEAVHEKRELILIEAHETGELNLDLEH